MPMSEFHSGGKFKVDSGADNFSLQVGAGVYSFH